MKSPHAFLVVAGLLLVVVAVFSHSSAQDAPVAVAVQPTRVAVCDVVGVLNKYQWAKDLNDELDKKHEAVAAEDKKRTGAIEQLEKVLKSLEPGSKNYDQTSTQMQELVLKQAVWRRLQEQTTMRWRLQHTEKMFGEILSAIEAVAKKQGYDLVIHRMDIPLASQSGTELLKKMAQRNCLYHDSSIDITKAVLDHANSQYAKRRK